MVFFSWSKERSKRYAKLTKSFLEEVFGTDKLIWFSEESIAEGTCFFESITRGADVCNAIILFLTPENLYNPWIQFELGLFYGKGNCHIWPILFGGELCQNSTAFEHIHLLKAERSALLRIVDKICELYEKEIFYSRSIIIERFNKHWDTFWLNARQVRCTYTDLGFDEVRDVVFRLDNQCHVQGRECNLFRVNRGFETYELYDFILSNTHRRLWVFGRKNKKMFDRGNVVHFKRFGQEIPNGFSFRCLFLDPSSDKNLIEHAQKKRHFENSLRVCIDDAIETLEESGFVSQQTIKLYRVIRNDAIIISDDTVYFENVKYSEDLKPMHLTNSGFFIASTDTVVGEYYLDVFRDIWDHAFTMGGSHEF